MQSRATDAK